MFGKERVNNSVDLLSRVLVSFSVGQMSALVAVTELAKFKRRLNSRLPHQHWSQTAQLCSMGRTVTHLLQLAVMDA